MNVDFARARAWAEVDLDALESNLAAARAECAPGVTLMAVLKANAYGLGAAEVARALSPLGVRDFCVACVSEGLQLLRAVPGARVLVMGATAAAQAPAAVRAGLRLTVGAEHEARSISLAAQLLGVQARVHFKVDTGLHRLGFQPESAAREIAPLCTLPGIAPEGLFSHLALRGAESDARAHRDFLAVRDTLARGGIRFPCAHLLDSIGMVRYPAWQMDAVRVGAYLYGNAPGGYAHPERVAPALAFKARVVRVARVPAGACVGYDSAHPLARDTLLATVSAGYADGYPRAMSYGVGKALVRGGRAPVAGLICMDQMTLDVTDIPGVLPGDEVTLLGGGIGLVEYAAWANMNRNEAMASIGRRVPRVYLRGGQAERVAAELEE